MQESIDERMNAMEILYELKTLKRQGWLDHGIPKDICESVADHSLHCGQAAYFFTRDYRLVEMMMLHDCPESIFGDTTPKEKMSKEMKFAREFLSMKIITGYLPEQMRSKTFGTWHEYAQKSSDHAILANQVDKMDASVRAMSYEYLGYKVDDYYPWTREALVDARLIKIFDTLMNRKHPLRFTRAYYYTLLGQNRI